MSSTPLSQSLSLDNERQRGVWWILRVYRLFKQNKKLTSRTTKCEVTHLAHKAHSHAPASSRAVTFTLYALLRPPVLPLRVKYVARSRQSRDQKPIEELRRDAQRVEPVGQRVQ